MQKIEIYDPAMCCSTGVCGPGVNPELLRVSTMIDALNKQGANIVRYNLANEPDAFVKNTLVNGLLEQDDILPVTLVNGKVAKTKSYPSNAEFAEYTGIAVDAGVTAKPASGGCCGGGSCC